MSRRLLALLIGFVPATLCAEGALRGVLFAGWGGAAPWAAAARDPTLYARLNGPDSWKLTALFGPREELRPTTWPDPIVGWTSHVIAAGTREHEAAPALAGRRPVLFFGDSFAQCLTPPEHCFQGLLARDELGERFAMLNYGVGGFGFDQALLLMELTVPLYEDLDPIVVLSILTEDNFDRGDLELRGLPKPRFEPEEQGFVLRTPSTLDPAELLERRPPEIRSYFLRLLSRGLPRLLDPPGSARPFEPNPDLELTRRRARWMLERALSFLEARRLRHAVQVFAGQFELRDLPGTLWQVPLVREVCAERCTSLLETRPYLEAWFTGTPDSLDEVLIAEGLGAGHYNALGNLLSFLPLRRWLAGTEDERTPSQVVAEIRSGGAVALMRVAEQRTLLGRRARLVHHLGPRAALVENFAVRGEPALRLRVSSVGPTTLELGHRGEARALRALVRSFRGETLVLRVLGDGRPVHELELAPKSGLVPLEIPLEGLASFGLQIETKHSTGIGGTLDVIRPRIE